MFKPIEDGKQVITAFIAYVNKRELSSQKVEKQVQVL